MQLKLSERWRTVPGYERYEVSDMGRVRIAIPYFRRPDLLNHVITNRIDKRYRYPYVDLTGEDRKSKRFYVHKLVMLAFVGVKPAGLEIRHIDGNRANSSLRNLKYGTHKENVQDAIKHGTFRFQPAGWRHTAESLRKISEASKRMHRARGHNVRS